jgi:hypothetical protein
MGTHGFIAIDNPANCPARSTLNLGGDAYRNPQHTSSSEFQFPTDPICAKVGLFYVALVLHAIYGL